MSWHAPKLSHHRSEISIAMSLKVAWQRRNEFAIFSDIRLPFLIHSLASSNSENPWPNIVANINDSGSEASEGG